MWCSSFLDRLHCPRPEGKSGVPGMRALWVRLATLACGFAAPPAGLDLLGFAGEFYTAEDTVRWRGMVEVVVEFAGDPNGAPLRRRPCFGTLDSRP